MRRRDLLLSAAATGNDSRAILYTARASTGFLNPGKRLALARHGRSRLVAFDKANEQNFGAYGVFPDGDLLLMSLSVPPDWKTRNFYDYYPQSRTRVWKGNPRTGALEELCRRQTIGNFVSPCLVMPGGARLAVTVIAGGKSVLYTMNLDGENAIALTSPSEYVYGVSLSPDGARFAFHADYKIGVVDVDGRERRTMPAGRGELCFGTSWSPDGKLVAFQICMAKEDPGHDWSAIAVTDMETVTRLTPPASAWFGASYGPATNPGGGSNIPGWYDASRVLFPMRIEGSRTPWQYAPNRPDKDHFNRDFRPKEARGGVHLALVDVRSRHIEALTKPEEGRWDFRPVVSGGEVAYVSARTGGSPQLRVVDRAGRIREFRSAGSGGAEHPMWITER
jgi:TolB protein